MNWAMNANRFYFDLYEKMDGSGATLSEAAQHVETELITHNLRCEMYMNLPKEVWFHLKPLAWLCIRPDQLILYRTSRKFVITDIGELPPPATTIKAMAFKVPLIHDPAERQVKMVSVPIRKIPLKGGKRR